MLNRADRRQWVLEAYLDGELSARRRSVVEQALAVDPQLRQELARLQQIQAAVRSLPSVGLPPELSQLPTRLALLNGTKLSAAEIDLLLVAYAYEELPERARIDVEQVLLVDRNHQQRVEEHQRVARAVSALPPSSLPTETLAVAIDRLHLEAVGSEQPVEDRPTRASWGEYLSAYLDGELSARKTSKIAQRLEENAAAREYMTSLSRVQVAVGRLPQERCPEALRQQVMQRIEQEMRPTRLEKPRSKVPVEAATAIELDWIDQDRSWQKPKRRVSWAILGTLAASIVLVAGLGYILAGIPVGSNQAPVIAQSVPPARPKEDPVSKPVEITKHRPAGYQRMIDLAKAPAEEVARAVDSRQITVSASDVNRFLDRLGPIGETLKRSEPLTQGRRLFELTGEPAEVAQLLGRLAETSALEENVDRMSIAQPDAEILANAMKNSDRWVMKAETRAVVEAITSLQEGLRSFGAQLDAWAEAKKRQEQKETIEDESAGPLVASAPTGVIPNQPAVFARPLRVLLLVSPAQAKQPSR